MHRGSLDDLESLRSGATAADGVIHTAYIHDFSKYKENCEIDCRAIEDPGSALVGSDRSLIFTSVTALVGQGRVATEDMPVSNASLLPRASFEEAAGSVAMREVRVSVIRLPPSVHGDGDHGLVPVLINIAREKSVSACIDDGLNRWPAVHRLDAHVCSDQPVARRVAVNRANGAPRAESAACVRGIHSRDSVNFPVLAIFLNVTSACA